MQKQQRSEPRTEVLTITLLQGKLYQIYHSPHKVLMESSQSPHGVLTVLMESSWSPHGVLVESSWSPCRVLMESMDSMKTLQGLHEDSVRTPPKIHRFYGESMDFGWTMISFGEIYNSQYLDLGSLFLLLPHYYKLMLLYLQTNTFYFLQSHILTNSYPILPHSCRVT